MKLQFTRVVAIVAGALIGISAFAGGAADKVTGHFRHAGPVNDPGDVIYSKTISAHEAFAGRPQRGFIYAVRPDGHTWEYIDLADTSTACVNVYGDGQARIGGLVTGGIGPGMGRFFGWELRDNGEPARLSDLTTTLRFDDADDLLAWCISGDTNWANAVWPHIVLSGNLQVHNFDSDAD
jgi:hypothetical protein